MAKTFEIENTIIDTSILVDYLRGVPLAVDFLDSIELPCISVITGMEIIQGSRNKKELEINFSFLNNFRIIEINREISKITMNLIKKYRLKYNAKILDTFIAATAINQNKKIITKNIKDFQFIKEIKIKNPY